MEIAKFSTFQADLERTRMIAAAQALVLERGVMAVDISDIAINLRVPVAAVERQFPTGKAEIMAACLEAHQREIHTRLLAQRQECSSAVEELLAMRRLLLQLISDTRSLFMQEMAVCYPTTNRRLLYERVTFTLSYMQDNLRRGVREGYYHAGLAVDEQAYKWLRRAEEVVGEAQSAGELNDTYYHLFEQYLTTISTPLGVYVMRRLQETPPYY